jgi:hypothetical protein
MDGTLMSWTLWMQILGLIITTGILVSAGVNSAIEKVGSERRKS